MTEFWATLKMSLEAYQDNLFDDLGTDFLVLTRALLKLSVEMNRLKFRGFMVLFAGKLVE